MPPALENNAAAGYQAPVKTKLLEATGAGLLSLIGFFNQSILLDNDTRLGKPVNYVLLTYQ